MKNELNKRLEAEIKDTEDRLDFWRPQIDLLGGPESYRGRTAFNLVKHLELTLSQLRRAEDTFKGT